MRQKFFYLSIIFITLSLSFTAHADQIIIEPAIGREPILEAIASTRHSLKLVMYGFTDKILLNRLIKEKQAGRSLQIILEKTPYNMPYENLPVIRALKKHNISWQGKIPPFKFIHQKTLLIDDKKAIVMTFNFTNSTYKKTRNFALIVDDPEDVKEIAEHFSADWNHRPIHGTSRHLIWSPDNSREKIISLIKQARQSLFIYAQSIQDGEIIKEIAHAAQSGVNVNILTSGKLKKKLAEYFKHAGVHVRYDKKLYIHAKAIIIDNKKAVIGSINFTRTSFDKNRELSVITENNAAIKQLSDVFKKDWHESVD